MNLNKLYNQGAIQLAHPLHNKFRLRKKENERASRNILAYKYMPDRAKSMATLQEYKNAHLEKEIYDDKAPNRNTGWIRPRVRDNEINPKLRYSVKNENERIEDYIRNASLINAEPLNTEILYNTPYRELNKNKWVSKKPYIVCKGHKQRQWSETKIQSDSPEPYLEAFREIERKQDTSRELTKAGFNASLPKDTWDHRINRSNSIRSYMGVIGAIKSVSPMTSLDLKKIKTMKSSHDFRDPMHETFTVTKEEEDAKRGKDVENATETLKLMHSPKTAPTVEATLKYTHNKSASNVQQKVDELHVHEKISKMKSYFKSAQSLIADELSKKAHRSRMQKLGSPGGSLCFSEHHSIMRPIDQTEAPDYTPVKEQSVQMFGSFKQKFLEPQLSGLKAKSSSKRNSELPMIRENMSTNRQSIQFKGTKKQKKDVKTILQENLKNRTIHHRNIIDAYFRKDRNLVRSKQNLMFKSVN